MEAKYVINLNDKKSNGTYWVSLFIDKNTVVYVDSFGIEYIPLEVLNKIKNKSITHNIFRMESDNSIMCRFCCIAFIEFMLVGKTLSDYANLFFTNDFKTVTR